MVGLVSVHKLVHPATEVVRVERMEVRMTLVQVVALRPGSRNRG